MAEPERAGDVRIALDELAEPLPRLGCGADLGVVLQDLGDERSGERDAENGRPAQERAVARAELVDARRHERFDRLGKVLGLVGLLPDAREALEEERVAGAALHERRQLFLGEAPIARCG